VALAPGTRLGVYEILSDHDFIFTLLRDPDTAKLLEAMDTRGEGEGIIRILDFRRHKLTNGDWVDGITFQADLTWPTHPQPRE